jgi:hypothetical protein
MVGPRRLVASTRGDHYPPSAARPDLDAHRLVGDLRDRLAQDPRLGPLLGVMPTPSRNAATVRHVDPLTGDLVRFVAEALGGRPDGGVAGLGRRLGRHIVDGDDYDLFGHHVLTGALDHRVGPDRLLTFAVMLSDLRRAVLAPGNAKSRRTL